MNLLAEIWSLFLVVMVHKGPIQSLWFHFCKKDLQRSIRKEILPSLNCFSIIPRSLWNFRFAGNSWTARSQHDGIIAASRLYFQACMCCTVLSDRVDGSYKISLLINEGFASLYNWCTHPSHYDYIYSFFSLSTHQKVDGLLYVRNLNNKCILFFSYEYKASYSINSISKFKLWGNSSISLRDHVYNEYSFKGI